MLKNKKGYIMIETLVAIIVFSVAMIGLLGLQTTAMSSNQSASSRSIASNDAYDLIDKMRTNKDGVIAGNYLNNTTGTDNSCRVVNFNTVHGAVQCTPAQMAADDLKEFFSQISTLPNGSAVICIDSSKAQGTPTSPNCDGLGNDYAIKVFWKDSKGQAMGKNNGYSQVIIGVQL